MYGLTKNKIIDKINLSFEFIIYWFIYFLYLFLNEHIYLIRLFHVYFWDKFFYFLNSSFTNFINILDISVNLIFFLKIDQLTHHLRKLKLFQKKSFLMEYFNIFVMKISLIYFLNLNCLIYLCLIRIF